MTDWQRQGVWEYEYTAAGYTGWYRCVGGRLADGRWPCWNDQGEERFDPGPPPSPSMGCRVPYTPCVLCGKEACRHLTAKPDPLPGVPRLIAEPPTNLRDT